MRGRATPAAAMVSGRRGTWRCAPRYRARRRSRDCPARCSSPPVPGARAASAPFEAGRRGAEASPTRPSTQRPRRERPSTSPPTLTSAARAAPAIAGGSRHIARQHRAAVDQPLADAVRRRRLGETTKRGPSTAGAQRRRRHRRRRTSTTRRRHRRKRPRASSAKGFGPPTRPRDPAGRSRRPGEPRLNGDLERGERNATPHRGFLSR